MRARRLALDWLARREHSRWELQDKLLKKGCSEALASEVLAELERERMLSDARFAESLVRARRERGYGPLRIQKEMQAKGVDPELIERCIDAGDPQWVEVLKRVRRKKFGGTRPRNYNERAKQARFLQYRGFTYDQIKCVLNSGDLE